MLQLQRFTTTFSPTLRGSLFYLIHWGAVGVYLPFLNVYFTELGLSGRQIGWLSAIFPLMTLFGAAPFSALADRRRWRVKMLQLAVFGLAISFFFIGLPRNFWAILIPLLVFAIVRSPVMALADSLIARMAVRHGLNFGDLRMWGSLGFAVAAVTCGAIWTRTGYGAMFLLTSLLFLPLIWLAGLLEEGDASSQTQTVPLSEIGRDRGLVALLIATWLIGATLGIGIIFEGILMANLGGNELLIGLFLGLIGFSEVPAMRASGPLIKQLGGLKTLLLAYLFFGGSFIGYIFASSQMMLLALALLRGFGFGLFISATIRLLDERAPDAWSSTVQSLREIGMSGLAPLIVAPIAGDGGDRFGLDAVFLLAATATGLAALVLLVAAVRKWLT
jgi:PPP family 3-phenylpropionic acid transporter